MQEAAMGHKVTLMPSGHSFEVPEGVSILTAGLDAGYLMPYSCRAATCRACRGRIVEGSVDFGGAIDSYLNAEERSAGYALLCSARPLADCVIEVAELSFVGAKPRMVPCRVKSIERPAPDVAVVEVRLPMNENFMFAAGQYIDILLKDKRRRSYSIATAPSAEGVTTLELHIRHMPGGVFTDHVFGALKVGEILRFEGPLGTFYLREDSDRPIVLLASGTGFAPIKAIVEHAIARGIRRPMTLYWGARARADLYMHEMAARWATEIPGFRYVPVLSEATPDDAWTGRTGFVHQAVMQDLPDLSAYQVYACGAPVMVDAARRDFTTECGLPEAEFLADSFITEADRAQH
jgi:CDP-4-dehydro-6-deoxyglucose reductase